MTDIVVLLRKYQPYNKLHSQAADEIERLRADLENVRDLNEHLTQELQSYYNEDEEIRRGRSGD